MESGINKVLSINGVVYCTYKIEGKCLYLNISMQICEDISVCESQYAMAISLLENKPISLVAYLNIKKP